MRLHLLENEDLKEIIFENRNKAYGAYQLRADYHRTLNRALMISLSSCCLFAGIIVFTGRTTKEKLPADIMRTLPHELSNFEIVHEQIKPMMKENVKPLKQATVLENTYKVVDVVKPVDKATTQTTQATIGTEQVTNASSTNTTTTTGTPNVFVETQAPIESAAADIAPEFPGGTEKFYHYLLNKLRFTPLAKDANLSGRYFATFIIAADGKINSIRMMKSIGYGMDEHVAEILAESPAWKPGYYHGQPVATIIRLPISFRMMQ